MDSKEFKALSEEEKVRLVNDRLRELKEEGQTTKAFRNENLDFSYSFVSKELERIGYARQDDAFTKEVKLSEYDIQKLKNLTYMYDRIMKDYRDEPSVKKRSDDETMTTSIRMYDKVWKRWQAFSKEWGIYNSADLLASAMEEYMNNHHFEDYETLNEQGKIIADEDNPRKRKR